jgi:hypothetical protein
VRKFLATIRLKHGVMQKVTVTADHSGAARLMLEAQYGKGCILNIVLVP